MNRPFLLYQIEVLRKAGIEDIILSLSYQPDKIEQVLGDGSEFGVRLTFLTEPTPLGTAGAYRFASEDLPEATIVLNGDILTNADLTKLIEQHQTSGAEATIALAVTENVTGYGLVETDKSNRITNFVEKPTTLDTPKKKTSTINAGIYILEPTVRDLIPNNENRSFEYHIFPALLEHNRKFCGYTLKNEYWRDVGTPESYLAAHMDFLADRIPGLSTDGSGDADIATTANVNGTSVIGGGCVIKPNAHIVNSVLGPGVHVEEKAVIENSVIWSHTRISSFSEIRGAVIARSCHIGRNVKIDEGTVLGDKASIPDYSHL